MREKVAGPYFDISIKKGLTAAQTFFQQLGINYSPIPNKKEEKKPPIIIKTAAAIPNGTGGSALGAYSKSKIKKGTILGFYHGEVREKNPGINENGYCFNTFSSTDDEKMVIIDALALRNWTACVNHSETPNLISCVMESEDKDTISESGCYIAYQALRTIQPGEQLTINYGRGYFKTFPIKPCYIHFSDNDKIPDEIYAENKTAYYPDLINIDEEIAKGMDLGSNRILLATKLFQAVYEENPSAVKKYLDLSQDVGFIRAADLPSYCLEKIENTPHYQIKSIFEQDNLTPLMLACFLGNEEIIKLLLSKSDQTRRSLKTGNHALFFLLKGAASKEDKVNITKLLISNRAKHLKLLNNKGESVLSLSLDQNNFELASLLLKKSLSKNRDRMLADVFKNWRDNQKGLITSCLLNNSEAWVKIACESLTKIEKYYSAEEAAFIIQNELAILSENLIHFDKALLNGILKLLEETPSDFLTEKLNEFKLKIAEPNIPSESNQMDLDESSSSQNDYKEQFNKLKPEIIEEMHDIDSSSFVNDQTLEEKKANSNISLEEESTSKKRKRKDTAKSTGTLKDYLEKFELKQSYKIDENRFLSEVYVAVYNNSEERRKTRAAIVETIRRYNKKSSNNNKIQNLFHIKTNNEAIEDKNKTRLILTKDEFNLLETGAPQSLTEKKKTLPLTKKQRKKRIVEFTLPEYFKCFELKDEKYVATFTREEENKRKGCMKAIKAFLGRHLENPYSQDFDYKSFIFCKTRTGSYVELTLKNYENLRLLIENCYQERGAKSARNISLLSTQTKKNDKPDEPYKKTETPTTTSFTVPNEDAAEIEALIQEHYRKKQVQSDSNMQIDPVSLPQSTAAQTSVTGFSLFSSVVSTSPNAIPKPINYSN